MSSSRYTTVSLPSPAALGAVVLLVLVACEEAEREPRLFELLTPAATGITFSNDLPEDPELNILNFISYYNGGGVAAGDVDGDGLPDLYFTSNLGPDRLFRNEGDYHFEDITERAGLGRDPGWTSGVTMADVNGDGHLDIHLSAVRYLNMPGGNILYINNGDATFTDRTDEFGLARNGYSTQAAFFDHDGDGDLDMYLLNYSTHTEQLEVGQHARRESRHPLAGDRLFRNDGNRFVDVSREAGIFGSAEGFGLGVVASDLNGDGCPDLFVANDFQENDFVYLNNCDGTFTESSATVLGHSSRFSMGVDAADFNNDGRPDVVVLDMLPAREDIRKTSSNAENFVVHDLKLRAGYGPQYARNTLQLNRGGGRFSEIGQLAGVQATDWSWAPLLADLDNDGHKDLFVTNGIYRRPNDLDFISLLSGQTMQASLSTGITEEHLELLDRMPHVPLSNFAYRNNGDLTFTDMAEVWGLAQPGFSNGAVYVDLNNSGALDLVINNINAPASIYRNLGRASNGHHHLKVLLIGSGRNTAGIGAKVLIKHGRDSQLLENMPTRGFQSSVDTRLHFGLGVSERVDSLIVIWPDHSSQVLTDVPADQTVRLSQDSAVHQGTPGRRATRSLFSEVQGGIGIEFRHEENGFIDYRREPLMPHRLSTEGPPIAVGDVNGDGLDDLYVGGARGQAGELFVQQAAGTFRASRQAVLLTDSVHEDTDAAFFDANADKALDLLVVSGGNEFAGEHEALRDRLYINDGGGHFRRDDNALPRLYENGSTVAPADFNGDGHVDLFIGNRVLSGNYGLVPESYLLQNDGSGRLADVTGEKAPALANAGMVTSAAWTDYDDDGALDLIVVGEWMPIRVFRQENGRFVERTLEAGFANTNGWWNTVVVADLDENGHDDLVLGNLGLNASIRASPTEPVRLYVHDFFQNGVLEQILTSYRNGVSYPSAGRDELVRAMPELGSRYISYADFGDSRIEDILRASQLKQARVHESHGFASSLALNDGNGSFDLQPLPIEAQFAPIQAVLAGDFDGEGHTDIVVAGNLHGVPPLHGRYDASYGLLLRGDGRGGLESVELETSGLLIDGEVRDLELLRLANGDPLVVVGRNDATLRLIRPVHFGKP